jgi:hypothetical protein
VGVVVLIQRGRERKGGVRCVARHPCRVLGGCGRERARGPRRRGGVEEHGAEASQKNKNDARHRRCKACLLSRHARRHRARYVGPRPHARTVRLSSGQRGPRVRRPPASHTLSLKKSRRPVGRGRRRRAARLHRHALHPAPPAHRRARPVAAHRRPHLRGGPVPPADGGLVCWGGRRVGCVFLQKLEQDAEREKKRGRALPDANADRALLDVGLSWA